MQSRVVQDAEDVKALKLATYGKLGAAGKVKPLYDFRSQMERMLSLVEAEEASLKEKAKHALMDEATAAVTARFASSADLKKSSLAGAIAALKGTAAGGKGGAAAPAAGGGPDVVQAAYIQFFKDKQKASQKVDEAAEAAAARRAIVTKLNAVATNEGFLFDFDPATGAPRMAA
jgi:membrane protease subunit (stomatin/prohibitin family)